jgi:hypothetical protein
MTVTIRMVLMLTNRRIPWLTPVDSISALLFEATFLASYDMVVNNLRRCVYSLAAISGIYMGLIPTP